MRPIHLFYSWQSDRERHVCANFIKIALEQAIAKLRSIAEIDIHLDSDTAGVPGTPLVSETILRKIRDCDLFVGDVTFVGQTEGGKYLPNPNVLTEFGFARGMLKNEQILLVMNTSFGPASDLPFDLAHLRYPTSYSLEANAGEGVRRARREAFADTLATRLEAMAKWVLDQRQSSSTVVDMAASARPLLDELLQLGRRGDVPALVSGPRLVMQVVPVLASHAPTLAPARVAAVRENFVPHGYHEVHKHVDTRQWASFDPPQPLTGKPNPECRWYTRLARPGVMEASMTIGAKIDNDETILIDGLPLEARLLETAKRLGAIISALGLDGPLLVAASLEMMDDVQVISSGKASRPLRQPSIWLGTVALSSAAEIDIVGLRPMLDAIWLGSGFENGSPLYHGEDGDVACILPEPTVVDRRDWR